MVSHAIDLVKLMLKNINYKFDINMKIAKLIIRRVFKLQNKVFKSVNTKY